MQIKLSRWFMYKNSKLRTLSTIIATRDHFVPKTTFHFIASTIKLDWIKDEIIAPNTEEHSRELFLNNRWMIAGQFLL